MTRYLFYIVVACAIASTAYSDHRAVFGKIWLDKYAVANAARVAVRIDTDYTGVGCGVFVGYENDDGVHVSILTARHVATFRDVISEDLKIVIGAECVPWRFKSTAERWRTSPCPYIDAAWVELTESELSELRALGFGEYVEIGSESWIDFDKFVKESTSDSVRAYMCLRGGVEPGLLEVRKPLRPLMPFQFNRRLHKANIPIVPLKSSRLALPGDSGCPIFVEVRKSDRINLALVGLAVGGNSIHKISAVMPLDEFAKGLKTGGVKLIDHPEFW